MVDKRTLEQGLPLEARIRGDSSSEMPAENSKDSNTKLLVDTADPEFAKDYASAREALRPLQASEYLRKTGPATLTAEEFKTEYKPGSRKWAEFVKNNPGEYKAILDRDWRNRLQRAEQLETGHVVERKFEAFLKAAAGESTERKSHLEAAYEKANSSLRQMAEKLGYDRAEIRVGGQSSPADKSGHDAFVEFEKGGKKFLLPFDLSGMNKRGKAHVLFIQENEFDLRTEKVMDRVFKELESFAVDKTGKNSGIVEAPPFYNELLEPQSLSKTIELMKAWGEHLKNKGATPVLNFEGQRILGEVVISRGKGITPIRYHEQLQRKLNQVVNEDELRASEILRKIASVPVLELVDESKVGKKGAKQQGAEQKGAARKPADSTTSEPVRYERKSPFEGRSSAPALAEASNAGLNSAQDRPLTAAELERKVRRTIENAEKSGDLQRAEYFKKELAALENPETTEKTAEKLNRRIAKSLMEKGGALASVFIIADYLDHVWEKAAQY